jgi:hypothetical protein
LKIFGDGMEAPVADVTPKSRGGVQMTEAEIREMVREVLRDENAKYST